MNFNMLQTEFATLVDRSGDNREILVEGLAPLLLDAGGDLNANGARQLQEYLTGIPFEDLHIGWFVAGIAWGRDAEDSREFVLSAVQAIKSSKPKDHKRAMRFALAGRHRRLENLLRAGRQIVLQERHPCPISAIEELNEYQQRLFKALQLLPDVQGIGNWNLGAMFFCAALSDPQWRVEMNKARPRLPMSAPIFHSMEQLYSLRVLSRQPNYNPWRPKDSSYPEALYSNNALLEELCQKLGTSRILDIHSGLYLLGTRNVDANSWLRC